jgi:preprotein translocase subunit SecG
MGGGAGFMSNRGTANVLTRATAILAGLFFATSLVLSIIAGFDRKPRSILDSGSTPAAPSAPAVPGTGGGVLDRLKGGTPQQAPAAPQAPAGPQVPRSQ